MWEKNLLRGLRLCTVPGTFLCHFLQLATPRTPVFKDSYVQKEPQGRLQCIQTVFLT